MVHTLLTSGSGDFLSRVRVLLRLVDYKDWTFKIRPDGERFYLQVAFEADGEPWTGRKWMLSEHMTDSEIICTALKAVLTAEEHEAREKFLYKGRAIFGPHIDVDALFEACTALDARTPVAAGDV